MARRRFSAAQLRAQRNFVKRFGGGRSRPARKARTQRRRVAARVPMARRRSSRKSSSSRRSFGRGASYSSIINGALGGAAASVATGYLGQTYGPAAGLIGVGLWRRDPVLQTMGGAAIGARLAANLSLPGAGAMGGGSGLVI